MEWRIAAWSRQDGSEAAGRRRSMPSSTRDTFSCSIPAKSMPQIERQARTRAENKLAKTPGFPDTMEVPSDAHVRVRLFKMRPPFREIQIDAGRAAAEMPEMLQGGPQAPGQLGRAS